MDNTYAKSFLSPQLTGNFVCDLGVLTKFLFIAVIAILSAVYQSIPILLGVIVFYYLLAFAAGKFKVFAKLYVKLTLAFGLFMFILRVLFLPIKTGTVIIDWGAIVITTDGILNSLQFTLLVVMFCGSIVLYTNLTPTKDIMYGLEQINLPHSGSYIVLNSFQSIINLGAKSKTILESQSARGIETEGNMITRFKAFIPILGPVILGAISDTEEKAIAMEARAFSSGKKNTHLYFLRKMPAWEKIANILLFAVCIAGIIWRFI